MSEKKREKTPFSSDTKDLQPLQTINDGTHPPNASWFKPRWRRVLSKGTLHLQSQAKYIVPKMLTLSNTPNNYLIKDLQRVKVQSGE